MAVPAAINTRNDPSKPPSTSPSSSTSTNPPPPEVVLTPATPSTPLHPSNKVAEPLPIPDEIKEDKMKEKEATDSQTALVGQKEQKKSQESKKGAAGSGPIDTLTRKLSGKSKSSTTGEKKAVITASAASEKPTTTPATASSSTAAKSTTRSVNPQQSKKPAPKKKKRSGFSGFLLMLGCLSADEFEDPEPNKGTAPAKKTETPGSSASTPAAAKNVASNAEKNASATKDTKPSTPPAGQQTARPETSTATGAVLASSSDEAAKSGSRESPVKPDDQVVVAPQEPTTGPTDETAGLTSAAVQAPGSGSALLSTPSRPSASRRQSESSPSSASPDGERTETSGGYSNISESEIPDESSGAAGAAYPDEYGLEEEYEDDEDRLIAQGGIGIPIDENGQPAPLLRPMDPDHTGRKCLVLDLDETLLHSSFKMLPSADYIVPVEIESQTHNVYVIKRPGVDHFLTEMGKIYEVVVFTASLSKYADPVMDMLDPARVIRHRLFRESCYNHKGNYVKDLSQLGREMESCIIIDNSPASYIFHPNNAVPVSTWFNDPHDTELTDLCPFLTDLATVDDIRGVLDGSI